MKKNMNNENTNENNNKYGDMMTVLKAMKHNEKLIERLQKKIESVKEANQKLTEDFKKLIDKE